MKKWKVYKALIRDFASFIRARIKDCPAAILMYHTVGYGPESLHPDQFRRQMQWLSENNYKVIRLKDLVQMLKSPLRQIDSRSIVLTFDDGYEDNHSKVLPVLREFEFPASVFLATDLIGSERVNKRGVRHRMLSWEQIKEMYKSGLIDFEPHSQRHIRLPYLSDADAETEMKISKKVIEERLGTICNFFAYPFGSYTSRDIGLARKYFQAAVTTSPGFIDKESNPWLLPRNAIDQWVNMLRFRLRV